MESGAARAAPAKGLQRLPQNPKTPKPQNPTVMFS